MDGFPRRFQHFSSFPHRWINSLLCECVCFSQFYRWIECDPDQQLDQIMRPFCNEQGIGVAVIDFPHNETPVELKEIEKMVFSSACSVSKLSAVTWNRFVGEDPCGC